MSRTRPPVVLRIALPLVVLVTAVALAFALVRMKPEVKTQPPVVKPPLVRVVETRLTERQLSVVSQGTVSPRTESALVPEVAGRVIWVADSLVSGGFFDAGQKLLQIDPHDYEQALVAAQADVAQARLRLAQEEAEYRVAADEWSDLGAGEADPLTLRKPQLENAKAVLAAAEANQRMAERRLERTSIRAPYAGRVRQKLVDVGQFVSVGAPVAHIYAVDYAEIRLPLPSADLAFLDLPLVYRGELPDDRGPRVTLRAQFAGREYAWEGRLVRTEGEIDPRSRLVHAVARVKDPYARGPNQRPPLAAGLFVEAEIEGRRVEGVAVLPREALRGKSTVYVIDADSRLRFRDIDLLRATHQEIVVRSGLADGELVCLSPIEAVTDGMQVRTVKDEPELVVEGRS